MANSILKSLLFDLFNFSSFLVLFLFDYFPNLPDPLSSLRLCLFTFLSFRVFRLFFRSVFSLLSFSTHSPFFLCYSSQCTLTSSTNFPRFVHHIEESRCLFFSPSLYLTSFSLSFCFNIPLSFFPLFPSLLCDLILDPFSNELFLSPPFTCP